MFMFQLVVSFVIHSLNMSEWSDKVAIITGASSGIGVGIALEFAKQGCSVALAGRNEKNLKDTAEKCSKLGLSKNKILCIVADMFNDDDVKSIVTKTVDKFGKINVLVNNAGMSKLDSFPKIDMKTYDDIMRVNVRSVVLLTQEAVPHLIKTKGSIVNISSIAGSNVFANFVAYSMSKAALDHFTRCIAVDLSPKKVRVNSIQPGAVDTPIFDKLGLSKEMKDNILKSNATKHPMGRLATVEDIAHTTVFLASDKSSFTTGQTVAIDGGFLGSIE